MLTKRRRFGLNWGTTQALATSEMSGAGLKGAGTGCDMSVCALDAYRAIRHEMVPH